MRKIAQSEWRRNRRKVKKMGSGLSNGDKVSSLCGVVEHGCEEETVDFVGYEMEFDGSQSRMTVDGIRVTEFGIDCLNRMSYLGRSKTSRSTTDVYYVAKIDCVLMRPFRSF